MEIDLRDPEIIAWQKQNVLLSKSGYTLLTEFFDDKEPEMWAIKGEERIPNNPPLIRYE